METPTSGDTPGVWLASAVWTLLEDKYGRGNIPSVRKLSRYIREANDGSAISHSQVHKLLSGNATNITDRTREMLGKFFGLPPSRFVPGPRPEESLAFRLSSLLPEEIAAIEKALQMVKEQRDLR